MSLNIGILLYEEVEVLDFAGPFEVFSTASRLKDDIPFKPFLLAQDNTPVSARGGFLAMPNYTFSIHPSLDILVVPGGDHTMQMDNRSCLNWVKTVSERCQLVASVCTGVFLLAQAGVAKDETVTTHWQDIELLREQFPKLNVVEDKAWVDCGALVTSGGISAGIDMSLHLVSKLVSPELAEQTARQMEYNWRQPTKA